MQRIEEINTNVATISTGIDYVKQVVSQLDGDLLRPRERPIMPREISVYEREQLATVLKSNRPADVYEAKKYREWRDGVLIARINNESNLETLLRVAGLTRNIGGYHELVVSFLKTYWQISEADIGEYETGLNKLLWIRAKVRDVMGSGPSCSYLDPLRSDRC